MSFMYVVPGETNNTVDVDKYGLGYAFDGPPQRGLLKGAFDSEHAAILSDASLQAGGILRYVPDEQVWKKVGPVYVGYWNEMPPSEESLRRPHQLTGEKVTLGQGEWLVPKAVSFQENENGIQFEHALSRYVDVNDEGELVMGDVEDQFQPLLDVALRWFQFDDHKFDDDENYFKCACDVMSFNYRVSVTEMVMLRLLTSDSAELIIRSCADFDSYVSLTQEADKKKVSVDSIMSDGETETLNPISQLVPTS